MHANKINHIVSYMIFEIIQYNNKFLMTNVFLKQIVPNLTHFCNFLCYNVYIV